MVFIVSELYFPEETSTGYILTKIAEGLAETVPVQVITGPPDYSGIKPAANYEIRNGVSIKRVKSLSLNKNKIASRLIRSIFLSFQLAAHTFKMLKKGDPVFVVTNPAPLLITMSLICKLKSSPLIILTHDVFPENLQAAQLLRPNSFGIRILARLFNWIYKSSDHIIVLGRDMKQIMSHKVRSNGPMITVIPNWADTADIYPDLRTSNPILNKLGLDSRFVVQFAGNIGRVQGIDLIVDAAEVLKGDNVHFVFVGNGAKKKWLIEQVEKRGLANVTVLESMPRAEQQLFLNACDVGLVSLSSGMTGLGVPSKTYNILAAGKPVVAVVDSASEIGLLIKEENLGWVVAPTDSVGLVAAIREASRSTNLDEIGRRARHVAETTYSLASIISKYREIVNLYEFKQ